MKPSDIFPEDEQLHFWCVVERCIRKYHAPFADDALARAADLYRHVDARPHDDMVMFYHDEPFYVACALARNELDVRDYAADYLAMRDAEPMFTDCGIDGVPATYDRRPRFLLCVSADGYPASLEPRKVYRGISDPAAEGRGMVRVVDESGDESLYPADLFVTVDIPAAAAEAFSAVAAVAAA